MNRTFRSLWNAASGTWVAAPETSSRGRCTGGKLAALGLVLACVASADAQTLYWDTNGTAAGLGGAGVWDTTNAYWNTNSTGTGGTVSAWNNGSLNSAVFAGTAGAVTLGIPITAGNLTFNTAGYTLSGSTLTLGGGTPTVTTTASATIGSVIAGTTGLIKAGAGTLTLSGANTFSGGITVNAGTLSVNANAALGNTANGITMAGGTALNLTGSLANSRVVTLTSGNVTLSGGATGARFTGAGGLLVQSGVTLNNSASNYTGQTIFNGTGTAAVSFSFASIANLGVASALGAPITAANGTVLVNASQGGTTVNYTGSGASNSNRNWTLQNAINGGSTTLRTQGAGTLTLTGDILMSGNGPVGGTFNAAGANMALLGVISEGGGFAKNVAYTGISTGTQTITLGGANTYTGNNTITRVTVQAPVLADVGTVSSLGTGSGASSPFNLINFGGRLSYTGAGASSNRVWNINNGTISNDGSGALTLSGTMAIAFGTATLGGSFSGATNSASGVISGAGGLVANGAGTWVLTGSNTYTGGTTISAGTLQLGNGGATGSIVGDVTNNAALVINRSDPVTFAGAISGTGAVTKLGTNTLTLTADNTYNGATTIDAGTLQLGNGGTTGAVAGDINNNGALVLNRSNAVTLGGAISGAGSLSQIGSGVTTLSGNSAAFSGSTSVSNGTLQVNGILGTAASTLNVSGGGTLGGTGTIGGSVSIADGILAPGNSPGTLTINGNLALTNASVLNYEFGQAGVVGGPLNDLTVVGGNLALDGTINVTVPPGGTYGPGLSRVISYGGALTDNGLILGTQPAGSVNLVQTSIPGQVNLINTAGLTLNFWDGGTAPRNNAVVNGGDGVWQASAGNANWTESTGAINAPYTNGSFAIFAGSPGAVTVDNSLGAVVSGGMQFATGGYVVQGQPITLAAGSNIVRVGDGTAPGAGYVATIASQLAGIGGIDKTDLGTLVLTGANSYTGGTTISAGTVQLGNGGTTGSIVGDVIDNGTLAFLRSDDFTFGNVISGTGSVTKLGTNTLSLTGANSYTGATTVAAGTLRAGAANTFSAASAHTVAQGATLDTAGFNQRVAALTHSGTVNLASGVAGSTLTVTGPYVGNGGLLRLGTALAGSASVSDRLVLEGPAAVANGSTGVQVVNLSGLGALTTGSGIEIISALNGATTTAQTTKSAFSLVGGHVDAGAFEYRLHAADALGAGESWYLRSTTTVVPPVIPPADPAAGLPLPPSLPPVQVPTYRAEVPLVAALPAQFRQADLAMLGNLHRRMGDEDPAAGPGSSAGTASAATAAGTRRAWGRLVYADLDIDQPGIAQPRSDGHVSGLQVGSDLFVAQDWKSGLYVGYLDGSADVAGNARGLTARVGSNDLRSRFLGAYATWMDASGWYVDSVLQGASQRYDVKPDINPRVSGKASSFTASIESGKPFAVNERWSIEPQAQLAWQHSSFDDLFLGGARVQQDADSGWIGRLGVRIKGDLAAGGGRLQPYGRLNLYYASFGDDAATFIGPAGATVIASGGGYSAAEVAAGATLALTAATSLYGELGHLWSIGGDATVKSSVQASLGIKVRW